MSIDNNGQPLNKSFNASRNKSKAVYGLKGILIGVTADQKLNEQELLFLDVWLRSQEYLKSDGDVIDLLDLIGDILKDGVVSKDELEELNDLFDDIIDYKEHGLSDDESKINELIGLLAGIASDSEITDSEVTVLTNWLNDNSIIQQVWPADVIISRLNNILEDGIVTQEEREDLLETINQITGVRFEETGLANGMATEFFEDDIDNVTYEGACFCFTGAFVSGVRRVIEDCVAKKGATIKKNITKEVTYLVIGTLASRDWRFTSHGRKIESALKLKNKGIPINIITERTWLKHA